MRATYGANADAVLALWPWPANADRFAQAYLVGAIMTNSALLTGIGGCGTLHLTEAFTRYTRTYPCHIAARNGPGLTPIPGYVWDDGHAAELAYLFPSFDDGNTIAPTFNAGERQLARDYRPVPGQGSSSPADTTTPTGRHTGRRSSTGRTGSCPCARPARAAR